MIVPFDPNLPPGVRITIYKAGKTKEARIERRKDPKLEPAIRYDYRFLTQFHVDYYVSVIRKRNPMVLKSHWVNWKMIRELNKPSLNSAIEICQRVGCYKIMEFKHD